MPLLHVNQKIKFKEVEMLNIMIFVIEECIYSCVELSHGTPQMCTVTIITLKTESLPHVRKEKGKTLKFLGDNILGYHYDANLWNDIFM